MLSPRLTNCPECANIPSLLKKIDCKLAELGNSLYNNISYMLNQPIPAGDILQLIAYRRILMHKYCNPNYVHEYSVAMIASRVIRLTLGCVSRCNEPERCLEEPCDITIVPNPPLTTTTTTTLPITTTTTSSTNTSTTSTSTTGVPTTTTTTTNGPAPSCPDRRVVFQICNSNAVVDDNFDIYLNGTYIGAVDLNANAQVGSVFIADSNPLVVLGSSDFVCPLTNMVTYHFSPSLLLASNVLEMRNTQNNGNGNVGSIGVRNYSLSGTTLSNPCLITNLGYSGASGASFTFNFNYTTCCAGDTTTTTSSSSTSTTTTTSSSSSTTTTTTTICQDCIAYGFPNPNDGNGTGTINGITVTTTYTGPSINAPGPRNNYNNCAGFPMDADTLYIAQLTGAFTLTISFSSPVNDIYISNSAMGYNLFPGQQECFTVNSDQGTPTLSLVGGCYDYGPVGNQICGSHQGGNTGGATRVSTTTPYTQLTITGTGISNLVGYGFDICFPSCNTTTTTSSTSSTSTTTSSTSSTTSTTTTLAPTGFNTIYTHFESFTPLTTTSSSTSSTSTTTSSSSTTTTTTTLAPINPDDIAGLWAWYKGDAGVIGGAQVTTWTDQSISGNDLLTELTAYPEAVTDTVGTLSTTVVRKVNFATLANMATAANFPNTNSTGSTMFVVCKVITSPGILQYVVKAPNMELYTNTTPAMNSVIGGGATLTQTVAYNQYYTFRNGTDLINEYFSVNNATTLTSPDAAGFYLARKFRIFAQNGPGTFPSEQGDVAFAEIIVYNTSLTPTEILGVETYLRNKYNHY